jgi:hypothetical protein
METYKIDFKFYGCLIQPEYVVIVNGEKFTIDPTVRTNEEAADIARDILKHEFKLDLPVDIVFQWGGQKM